MCKEKSTTEKSKGNGCGAGCPEMKRCVPILGVLLAAIAIPLMVKKLKGSCPCAGGHKTEAAGQEPACCGS
jgi:hypothetical protein